MTWTSNSKPNANGGKENLCWTCKYACGGCAWSDRFEHIKGWDAIESRRPNRCLGSMQIFDCPMYQPGIEHIKPQINTMPNFKKLASEVIKDSVRILIKSYKVCNTTYSKKSLMMAREHIKKEEAFLRSGECELYLAIINTDLTGEDFIKKAKRIAKNDKDAIQEIDGSKIHKR